MIKIKWENFPTYPKARCILDEKNTWKRCAEENREIQFLCIFLTKINNKHGARAKNKSRRSCLTLTPMTHGSNRGIQLNKMQISLVLDARENREFLNQQFVSFCLPSFQSFTVDFYLSSCFLVVYKKHLAGKTRKYFY